MAKIVKKEKIGRRGGRPKSRTLAEARQQAGFQPIEEGGRLPTSLKGLKALYKLRQIQNGVGLPPTTLP